MTSSVWDRGGIFICYRRQDTAALARPLYAHLRARFGEDRVFMDIHSITLGVDFTEKVIGILAGCNVLLVLIGRDWSASTDSKGARRLDNPDDWVRIEIETALQRDIRVIPILVEGAELPQADDLPPSLRPLIRRQAGKLSHASFESDVTSLIANARTQVKRRQSSQLKVTRIHAPAVNVPALAEALRLWYEEQGLEAILVTTPIALIVQCRARKRSERTFNMSSLLTVILQNKGQDLHIEIGSAKWLGATKAGVATATTAGVGLAAASLVLAPVAILAGGVAVGATATGMVARQLRQSRLARQTVNFLRETAPTHVRGA